MSYCTGTQANNTNLQDLQCRQDASALFGASCVSRLATSKLPNGFLAQRLHFALGLTATWNVAMASYLHILDTKN